MIVYNPLASCRIRASIIELLFGVTRSRCPLLRTKPLSSHSNSGTLRCDISGKTSFGPPDVRLSNVILFPWKFRELGVYCGLGFVRTFVQKIP